MEFFLTAAVIGDQLVWQAGDLPEENKKAAITLTEEVDSDVLLGQAYLMLERHKYIHNPWVEEFFLFFQDIFNCFFL